MNVTIAGIRRGSQYSPNHIGNDAAIFNLTAGRLRQCGYEVKEYSEVEFLEAGIQEAVIFNMARDTASIKKLQLLETQGHLVINSAFGIENCTRERMTRILLSNNIPHPESLILGTDEPLPLSLRFLNTHCWVKRGDFHAIHREDVTYTRNPEETGSVLNEYALRHIKTAVINEHLEGDLVKFYGVAGSDFFYWFYPDEHSHSKFGWERINGKAKGIAFDVDKLIEICNLASTALNIDIYGGDGVVMKDGSVKIIDFNDWPSFAPCRTLAAPHIARCIMDKISATLLKSEIHYHGRNK